MNEDRDERQGELDPDSLVEDDRHLAHPWEWHLQVTL